MPVLICAARRCILPESGAQTETRMEQIAFEQDLQIQKGQLDDARLKLEQSDAHLGVEYEAKSSRTAAFESLHCQLAEERGHVMALIESEAEMHSKQEIGEPLEKPLIKGIRENHLKSH